jgi:DNA-directed RNA polymerase specialized sigma24 family protein
VTIATQTYNDLTVEIDTLKIRIKDLEREKKYLRRRMYDNAPRGKMTVSYDSERVTGGQTPMTLDKVLERLNKIDNQIDHLYGLLEVKIDACKRIDQIIKSSEDLDQKVVYMRDYKKMSLRKIADELGYSHDHIRRISSRNRKHATFMPHSVR